MDPVAPTDGTAAAEAAAFEQAFAEQAMPALLSIVFGIARKALTEPLQEINETMAELEKDSSQEA